MVAGQRLQLCIKLYLLYLVAFSVYQIGNLVITGTFTFATVIAILVVIGFVYLLVRPYKEDNRLNIDLNKTVTEK